LDGRKSKVGMINNRVTVDDYNIFLYPPLIRRLRCADIYVRADSIVCRS
jgi:hypothetical protein